MNTLDAVQEGQYYSVAVALSSFSEVDFHSVLLLHLALSCNPPPSSLTPLRASPAEPALSLSYRKGIYAQ